MKIVGIIFIVISALNMVAWLSRSSQGEPIGSPAYIVLVLVLLIAGLFMVASNKKNESEENK